MMGVTSSRRSAQLLLLSACCSGPASSSQGFVSDWLTSLAAGTAPVPIAVQLCKLQPAGPAPSKPTACNITGSWTYRGGTYQYHIIEDADRGFQFSSNASSDPWRHATGHFLPVNSSLPSTPARCLGGMVTGDKNQQYDIEMDFNCSKSSPVGRPPQIIKHKGTFTPDCGTIHMDDGGYYTRVGSVESGASQRVPPDPAGCTVVELAPKPGAALSWSPAARDGWKQSTMTYQLLRGAAGGAVLADFDVTLRVDKDSTVVRLNTTITAHETLDSCLGGLAILKLDLPHSSPTLLYGSTGGPAGGATALQPWQCALGAEAVNGSCQHVDGTPFLPHETLATSKHVAAVDSGLDGRSSNFQLAIHSVAIGVDNASSTTGIWMGPEYSGLWRQDTWSTATGSRFYWSLPSMRFTMSAGETVALPAAAFGEWSADGGDSDWSNAVRQAISSHFTPLADRQTGERPVAKATYQGLGALPSYQTEDVLYTTVAHAGRLGLEQWTWDAGTYTWCKPSSVCNGTAVTQGKCCDFQGDWFAQQGDYMPKDTRFPEHGFMALQRKVGEAVGATGSRANMGVWITPQAASSSQSYKNHPELYLESTQPTNYLLNLKLPEAQDHFFNQFETLILKYNCSRIWFDYNTASRQTHWNLRESAERQGDLELGFYAGLYSVFERLLEKYPSVWIEGCASGGRMMDLGSLGRTMSMWINDDSVSDDRNRRLRLGANHFLPSHYLQNAFLPVGLGAVSQKPIEIDPQRLLSYFNGVLQFGQGLGFWSNSSLDAATTIVSQYKSIRQYLDPLTCNYYRLFQKPTADGAQQPVNITAFPVGNIFERRSEPHDGTLFVMAQAAQPGPPPWVVKIALSRAAGWPLDIPAPWFVRSGVVPKFELLAGAEGTTGAVTPDGLFFEVTFPDVAGGSQAIFKFTQQ